MRRQVGIVAFVIAVAWSALAFAKFFSMGHGAGPTPLPVFLSISMSNTSFTTGSSGAVGHATATLSNGLLSPTWSIKTSGVDNTGATCNNYGSNLTIDASGTVSNSASAAAGSYPGTCIQVTQGNVANSPFVQAFTITGFAPGTFTSITMSNTSFSAGVAGVVGNAAATVSSGTLSPTWSIQTSGVDHSSTTCNNYGTNFTINGSGVVSNSTGATNASYPGVCIQVAQAGVNNSPYSQAFTLTSNAATGISLNPATANLVDTTTQGTVLSTATVTVSGGGSFSGSITTSNTDKFCTNGMNIVANRSFTSADDGPFSTTITAVPGSNTTPCSSAVTINSVQMSCGSSCGFTSGTVGTIGTATATMSSGSFTGSWNFKTSGTATVGGACSDQTANFTINSSTGAVSNTSGAAAGTFNGVCVQATQAGANGSPYSLAVTITGATGGSGALPGSMLPPGTWVNDFNDDFNGTSINTANWSWRQTPNADGSVSVGSGILCDDGSDHLTIGGGLATLHPWNPSGTQCPSGDYGAASLSQTFYTGPFGYFESRFQIGGDNYTVFWPTVPGWGTRCGQGLAAGWEADIWEGYGAGGKQQLIWDGPSGCGTLTAAEGLDNSGGFHVWGMDWDATNGITFYRDGVQTLHINGPAPEPQTNPHVQFNAAAWGANTGVMDVDWFRHYHRQ